MIFRTASGCNHFFPTHHKDFNTHLLKYWAMFVRGDQLRIAEVEGSFRLHSIEYSWEGFEPELYVFNLDDKQLSPLRFDEKLELSVSRRRICVGSFVNGQYIRCPKEVSITKFSQCSECSKELIPIQACLFEPKCDGDLCDSRICRRDHAIYISFFGTKPKVGMTLKNRVKKRLIEQGADAYFLVGIFGTRKSAREQEKNIARELRITERPASSTVLRSLQLPKRRQQIETLWGVMCEHLERAMSLNPGKLEFLDHYPLEEPLVQVPRLADSWGMHSGKIVGIKGKFLIYNSEHLTALKLSDLPSRFLSIGSL